MGAAEGRGMTVVAGVYFAIQAVNGSILWAVSTRSDTVRSWLEVDAARRAVTNGFAAADLAVIVLGSLLAAAGLLLGRRWGVAAALVTTGAVLYPTAFLVAWVATVPGAETMGLALMIPTSVVSALASWLAWRSLR